MGDTQERPISRRGIKSGMDTVEVVRPRTSQKYAFSKKSEAQRIPTSNQMQTGFVVQPPRTGTIQTETMDRPLTQQGLSGLRTATARGPARQIMDKRYYEGVLRQKMKEIANQITQLRNVNQQQTKEVTTGDIYEGRVKEIAVELTKLQGDLVDYNSVVDQINVGMDGKDIMIETNELRERIKQETNLMEQLYVQNVEIEQKLSQVEKDVENENNAYLNAINDMTPSEGSKYEELKEINENFLSDIRNQQERLDYLSNEKFQLQNRISHSQIKQQAVVLYEKLGEKLERKESLLAEETKSTTPAHERERLLQKVKDDNVEISAIDRQTAQLTDQIAAKKEALEQIEKDLEEGQSDRYQKIKDLRARSETMEQFLATFDENKDSEVHKIENLENRVENILNLMRAHNNQEHELFSSDSGIFDVPSANGKELSDEELEAASRKTKDNLKKLDTLQLNVQGEIQSLKEKLSQLTKDLEIFTDLEGLRDESRKQREQLLKKRETLLGKKPDLEKLGELRQRNKELMAHLGDDETYMQLHNLETKLELLEQSNERIRHFTKERKDELYYRDTKMAALELIKKYNDILKSTVVYTKIN